MDTVAKLYLSPEKFYCLSFKEPFRNVQPFLHKKPAKFDGVTSIMGHKNGCRGGLLSLQKCKAFRSEEEGEGKLVKDDKKKKKNALSSLKSAILKLSGGGESRKEEYQSVVAKVEEIFFSCATQIGRYLITMMSTGVIVAVGFQISGGDSHLNTLIWYSWLGGIIIGTMIGANLVLEEMARKGPRNVVITGSTRGLGKALAREFLLSGDRVVIASAGAHSTFFFQSSSQLILVAGPESVQTTVRELEENLREGILSLGEKSKDKLSHAKVVGIACDVGNPDDVEKLSNFAVGELGVIDIWINNAGTNKGFRPLLDFTNEDIEQIVSTNLVGSLLCTREAMRVMELQGKAGHIFNMDGAGSGGSSTPLTAVYGSTKCGLRQLQSSLLKESKRCRVGVHTASPGMVLTELLLSGASLKNKQAFNIICELPETVARTLVPRMRVVKGTGKSINYLTPPRILLALVSAWVRRGRWFDDKGRALYASEADRIRNWAESRARFSFTDAMEMYTENTWVSVFSLSVVCAFIILSSATPILPGT